VFDIYTLYEIRTIKARDAKRITEVEMKCMRKTADTLGTDYKRHRDCTEINIIPVLDKIQE